MGLAERSGGSPAAPVASPSGPAPPVLGEVRVQRGPDGGRLLLVDGATDDGRVSVRLWPAAGGGRPVRRWPTLASQAGAFGVSLTIPPWIRAGAYSVAVATPGGPEVRRAVTIPGPLPGRARGGTGRHH